jgi:hypothetical protein
MFGVNAQRRSGVPQKGKAPRRHQPAGKVKKPAGPPAVSRQRAPRPSIESVMAKRFYTHREEFVRDMALMIGPEGGATLLQRIERLEQTMADLGDAAAAELGDVEDAHQVENT